MAGDGAPFPYMRWAKAHLDLTDRTSLGLSGRPRPPLEELPEVRAALASPPADPEGRLREALARRHGVDPAGVHLACGTSHANFLVYLAFARGGLVASETPTYEAFLGLGEAVGARVTTFERRADRGWRLDARAVARAADEGARLFVVTDLHNPSGARLRGDDLDLLLDGAERTDGLVLVDEVYLDLDPRDRPTAAQRSPRVLVTSSLTKAHGVWDLRAGWILGAPERIAAIAAWDDLVCPRLPLLPMVATLAFLPLARERLEATRREAALRRAQVEAWVRERGDVRWTPPEAGFSGLLSLGAPGAPLDGARVAALAWEGAGIRVVPGSFFQVPDALRISFLLEEEHLARALAGLGHALDRAQAEAGASPSP